MIHHKFTALSDRLYQYLLAHSAPPDAILEDLIAETEKIGRLAVMQIAPDQGALLTMLGKLINAKLAIEVGTFTGYSGISIARGLAEGGQLITCDISKEYTTIAKRYFARAGLDNKITLKLGPAVETLAKLDVRDVDIAFIDADKTNYRNYYEAILPKMRKNGLIIFDNVLWGGAVVSRWANDADTVAIRELNDFLVQDSRVDVVMLPVADGLLLARKK